MAAALMSSSAPTLVTVTVTAVSVVLAALIALRLLGLESLLPLAAAKASLNAAREKLGHEFFKRHFFLSRQQI